MRQSFERLLGPDGVWEVGANSSIGSELLTGDDVVAVAPTTPEECAEVLGVAAERGLKVLTWGAGLHQRNSNLPERIDVVLVTSRMIGVVDHDVADQTLVARAGTRVGDLVALAREQDQLLPLDPAGLAHATIGGVVAAGINGSLRCGYGLARDFLLGSLTAHPDGTLSRSGGRLVKNVTGFDLHRLYHGSQGALAVLCEVNLRLLPYPEAERTVVAGFDDLDRLDRFLVGFRRGGALPASFVVADAPALAEQGFDLRQLGMEEIDGWHVVLVRFHGTQRSTLADAERCRDLLGESGAELVEEVEENRQAFVWSVVRELLPGLDRNRTGLVLKICLLPMREGRSALGGVIETVVARLAGSGQLPHVLLEPMSGVLRVALAGPPSDELLSGLGRQLEQQAGGMLTVESAPPGWRRSRDLLLGQAMAPRLATRVGRALDERDVLAPGRFGQGERWVG